MARLVDQLTEAKIRTLTKIGLHADGRGLYLQVRPASRSWIFRFRLNDHTRDMGLGGLADVSLVKARAKATAARALVAQGIDPIEHSKAQADARVAQLALGWEYRGFRIQQAPVVYIGLEGREGLPARKETFARRSLYPFSPIRGLQV